VLSVLRLAAPIGLILAGGPGLVALGSALLLVLAHITMPHTSNWTIYYLDVFPVVAFGVVIATTRAVGAMALRVRTLRPLAARGDSVALLAAGALLMAGATTWAPPKIDQHGWMRREVVFRAGVCALPSGPKTVFVTRRPGSSPHHLLVDNDPDWQQSDVWVVRTWDQQRHRALLAAAPERAAYHYDEQSGWFTKMEPSGVPAEPPGMVHVLRTDLSRGRGIDCG
jgi:hypothetical protein